LRRSVAPESGGRNRVISVADRRNKAIAPYKRAAGLPLNWRGIARGRAIDLQYQPLNGAANPRGRGIAALLDRAASVIPKPGEWRASPC